eukprot:COSAG02_NODE_1477_length_12419_cov_15.891396_12_plen_47_part_00
MPEIVSAIAPRIFLYFCQCYGKILDSENPLRNRAHLESPPFSRITD